MDAAPTTRGDGPSQRNRWRSASGTRLETAEQVVVTVTPEERGRVVIEGFEVTYRDGIRLGTQRSGARIEVGTPEDAPSG